MALFDGFMCAIGDDDGNHYDDYPNDYLYKAPKLHCGRKRAYKLARFEAQNL